tara:strand:- start:16322 stop:16540 length:219 start_codon:yes stop_codon:yes gene_type:complete
MSDLIIWKNDDGVLQVTHPSYNCGLSVDEIAKKDLPSGKKYKIIPAEELPVWDEFRDAWTCPDDYLDTGVAD